MLIRRVSNLWIQQSLARDHQATFRNLPNTWARNCITRCSSILSRLAQLMHVRAPTRSAPYLSGGGVENRHRIIRGCPGNLLVLVLRGFHRINLRRCQEVRAGARQERFWLGQMCCAPIAFTMPVARSKFSGMTRVSPDARTRDGVKRSAGAGTVVEASTFTNTHEDARGALTVRKNGRGLSDTYVYQRKNDPERTPKSNSRLCCATGRAVAIEHMTRRQYHNQHQRGRPETGHGLFSDAKIEHYLAGCIHSGNKRKS